MHAAGLVFALPSNADAVLRIDPATQLVSTIGGRLEGDWKWHGGNLGDDGIIYGVPCNAESVCCVDPRTSAVTMIGSFPGRQKWYGGVRAASGAIYGIPHTATGVLKITPGRDGVEPRSALETASPRDKNIGVPPVHSAPMVQQSARRNELLIATSGADFSKGVR